MQISILISAQKSFFVQSILRLQDWTKVKIKVCPDSLQASFFNRFWQLILMTSMHVNKLESGTLKISNVPSYTVETSFTQRDYFDLPI